MSIKLCQNYNLVKYCVGYGIITLNLTCNWLEAQNCTPYQVNRPTETSINFVFVGHGYSEPDLYKFKNYVTISMRRFFQFSPLKEYQYFFNIWYVKQSAIICGDDLDSCSYYLPKIVELASQCPYDKIIVVHSSDTYGGFSRISEPFIAFVYADTVRTALTTHELGHSFGLLMDEYNYSRIGKPYLSGANCDEDPNCSKWADLPGTSCYLGCTYANLYRDSISSVMKSVYSPYFGESSKRQLLKQIDKYVDLVSDLNPDNDVYMDIGSTTVFTVQLPSLQDPTTIQWYIDDVEQLSEINKTTFTFTGIQISTYTVKVKASYLKLEETYFWQVYVTLPNTPPEIIAVTPANDPTINEAERIYFTQTSTDTTDDILFYTWYFDNQQVSTQPSWTYQSNYESAGVHSIKFEVKDKRGASATHTWQVTVRNDPLATISLNPTLLNLNFSVGDDTQKMETTFRIMNIGEPGTTLNWLAINTVAWLTFFPSSGTCYSGDTSTVTVSVNIIGLSTGTYNTVIAVNDNKATNYSQTIAVTLNLTPPQPTILLNPISLSFSSIGNISYPTIQSFTITNIGKPGSTLNWVDFSNVPWLTLSQTSGSLEKNNSDIVTVSVNALSMDAGTYTGTITVSDYTATITTQTVTVVLKIYPYLLIEPTDLTFSTVQGDVNPPAVQIVTLTNTNLTESAINWKLTENTDWLIIPTTQGFLLNGESKVISVLVNPASLTTNVYFTTFTVSHSEIVNQSVMVTLKISTPTPTISLSPTSVIFSAKLGTTNINGQTFTISNIGNKDFILNWSISKEVNWVSVFPTSGTLTYQSTELVTVLPNIQGLNQSKYETELVVIDSNALNSPQRVIVTLTLQKSISSISGKVTKSKGTGIPEVSMELKKSGVSLYEITTDVNGYYEFIRLSYGDYTVTPVKFGYSFTPESKTYPSLSNSVDNQDYVTVNVPEVNTVRPAEFHFGTASGLRKKISELERKIEASSP